MTEIKDSVIATNHSTVKNVKNTEINYNSEKKKSFWKGFLVGILSSLVGSIIWYGLSNYFEF